MNTKILEQTPRREPATAGVMLAREKEAEQSQKYRAANGMTTGAAQILEEKQQNLGEANRRFRNRHREFGYDPDRIYYAYSGITMTQPIWEEILRRAGNPEIPKKSELAELRKVQSTWDECETLLLQTTPDTVRARFNEQYSAKGTAKEIAELKFITYDQLWEEATCRRKLIKLKLAEIARSADGIFASLAERISEAVHGVLKAVECEEKTFARKIGLEDWPSQFRIAVGQLSYIIEDRLKNEAEAPCSPKVKFSVIIPNWKDNFK